MASNLTDISNLINSLSGMFLDKEINTQGTVSPQASSAIQQIIAAMAPQMTGQLISDQDIAGLVQNVLLQSQQELLKTRAQAGQLGGYGSTGLQLLEQQATSRALQQALGQLINAKQVNAQTSQGAAQVAGQAAGNLAQSTRGTQQTTEAPLGGLAGPLAAYAAYKFLTAPSKVASGATAATGAAKAASGAAGVSTAAKAAGAGKAAQGAGTVADALFSPGTTTGLGSDLAGLLSAPGDFASSIASSSFMPGEVAGIPSSSGAMGGIFDALGLGGVAESLGGLGDTVGQITDFFTPSIDIPGIGPTGIPLLAGLGGLMEGNVGRAVGDIGATAAVAAIPVVGPLLALGSGFTKNGILDDWFGIECYMTTAVMHEMQDSFDDSGPELTAWRKFRDGYMMETPARMLMVTDYYNYAPEVVKSINQKEDKKEIYHHFYKDYIKPGYEHIKVGNNDEAFKLYTNMISEAAEYAGA